jgi:hypothetical protein
MGAYIQQNWDKILTAIIATYAAVLSTYTFLREIRRDRREEEKLNRDENTKLTRVLLETGETAKKVEFLDEWIFSKKIFSRKQAILNALIDISNYWKTNADDLSHFLATNSQTYKALSGLFDVAQQNLKNEPPPSGLGAWRGITQENLFGLTVQQIFSQAESELKRRRSSQ